MEAVLSPTIRGLSAMLLLLCACTGGRCRVDVDSDSPRPTDSPDDDSQVDDSTPAPDLGEVPVVFVADGANGRVIVVRMDTAELMYQVDFAALHPAICADGAGYTCVGFGIEPHYDADSDEDRLLYVIHPSADGADAPDVPSIVGMARLADEGPEVLWSLDSLDFSVRYGDQASLCAATEPCSAPLDDWARWRGCSLSNVHSAAIAEDDDDSVLLWISDTGTPTRALAVRLDKASTCGVVEELLDQSGHPDWGSYDNLNDLDPFSGQGDISLLGTFFSTSSTLPVGGPGLGRVVAWQQVADSWELDWACPDTPMSDEAFLNAPHNADMVEIDGQRYVVYAHSNGLGGHWEFEGWTQEDDHRGSIGVLRVDEDGIQYLFDGYHPDDDLHFLRDVDLLGDGSWLLTDSGCVNNLLGDCEHRPGLWNVRLDPGAVEPVEGLDGRWQADHAYQQLLPLEVLHDRWASPLDCGLDTPYEADFRWAADLGATLRARALEPIAACAD